MNTISNLLYRAIEQLVIAFGSSLRLLSSPTGIKKKTISWSCFSKTTPKYLIKNHSKADCSNGAPMILSSSVRNSSTIFWRSRFLVSSLSWPSGTQSRTSVALSTTRSRRLRSSNHQVRATWKRMKVIWKMKVLRKATMKTRIKYWWIRRGARSFTTGRRTWKLTLNRCVHPRSNSKTSLAIVVLQGACVKQQRPWPAAADLTHTTRVERSMITELL